MLCYYKHAAMTFFVPASLCMCVNISLGLVTRSGIVESWGTLLNWPL